MLKNESKQNLEEKVVATDVMPEVEVKESKLTKVVRVTKKVGGYVLAFLAGLGGGYLLASKNNNTECYEDSNVIEEENINSDEE